MELLQEILVFVAVILAIGFLVKKFFFKKNKTTGSCGGNSCGCH